MTMTRHQEIYALKVLSEMIEDRGYCIDYMKNNDENDENDENENNVKNESDTQSEQNDDDHKEEIPSYVIKAFHTTNHKNIILCFLSEEDKLNIQGIKEKISIMNKENADRCIIVYRTSVTSSAKKSLETLRYNFELFGLHELQLNITKHRLVPRHEKASLEEKNELDKSYKGKLPVLLHTDPVSRYYAFQRGDYIRITRKNGTIHYRVVK